MARSKITDADLLAFASGELDGETADRIESHLADDPVARAFVERFRAVRRVWSTDDTEAAPAAVIDRARAIFEAPERRDMLQVAGELLARLIFDSRVQAAAVRRGVAERIQLTWETDTAEIELQAEPRDGRWSVTGQITVDAGTAPPDRVAVVVANEDEPRAEAPVDERGLFELTIEPGRCALRLTGGTNDILLRDLELAPP